MSWFSWFRRPALPESGTLNRDLELLLSRQRRAVELLQDHLPAEVRATEPIRRALQLLGVHTPSCDA